MPLYQLLHSLLCLLAGWILGTYRHIAHRDLGHFLHRAPGMLRVEEGLHIDDVFVAGQDQAFLQDRR